MNGPQFDFLIHIGLHSILLLMLALVILVFSIYFVINLIDLIKYIRKDDKTIGELILIIILFIFFSATIIFSSIYLYTTAKNYYVDFKSGIIYEENVKIDDFYIAGDYELFKVDTVTINGKVYKYSAEKIPIELDKSKTYNVFYVNNSSLLIQIKEVVIKEEESEEEAKIE